MEQRVGHTIEIGTTGFSEAEPLWLEAPGNRRKRSLGPGTSEQTYARPKIMLKHLLVRVNWPGFTRQKAGMYNAAGRRWTFASR